jgi:type III restriction enzyme
MPIGKPKVVAWFVPSDTILKQTYRNLSDTSHPYRQKIDSHFNGRVQIVDKEDALMGHNIRPNQIGEQLTIFVLSVQSFATNTKDGRRVYRENENLEEYAKLYDNMTKRVGGSDETGFIQVLSYLNPVVIIDESHNFEANLRVEMLNSINPCFIMDLTATPRKKSNIISFVDAIKLKRANMVKLPVIVYNHRSTDDVIVKAIKLQRSLEFKAKEQESNGGKYIRPIVLFQAQPRTNDDNITFEKIKNKLIEIGIPEEQIKIKTADKDELKSVDLMSRDCPVRYIITVNALKEGWDCPFAYILASLANKTSRVDVEQILGRILRLPYTTKHNVDLLNLSYVFTASNDFKETLENIVKSLNNAGYSKRDYRIQDTQEVSQNREEELLPLSDLFEVNEEPQIHKVIKEENSIVSDNSEVEFNPEAIKESINSEQAQNEIKEIEEFAEKTSNQFEEEMIEVEKENDDTPNEIKDMAKYYKIKKVFEDDARNIKLPIFVKKVNTTSIFETEGEIVPLDKKMLSEGFDLSVADKTINFARTDVEAKIIDLDSQNEYTPVAMNINPKALETIRNHFKTLPTESKKKNLATSIARNIKLDEISEQKIADYIQDVIEKFDDEELSDMMFNSFEITNKIKQKINSLLTAYQEKVFNDLLDIGELKCGFPYEFPSHITYKKTAIGVFKGLYSEEDGDINNFEYKVINAVANLDNVVFWHRNQERSKGFFINGYINHYPDFIIYLKSGKIIILETKGDDRDNTDSRRKLELGLKWASKAGDNYRYFMVFDKTEMKGAITLPELLDKIKRM